MKTLVNAIFGIDAEPGDGLKKDLQKRVTTAWKDAVAKQPAAVKKDLGTDPAKYLIKTLKSGNHKLDRDLAFTVDTLALAGISDEDATTYFKHFIVGKY